MSLNSTGIVREKSTAEKPAQRPGTTGKRVGRGAAEHEQVAKKLYFAVSFVYPVGSFLAGSMSPIANTYNTYSDDQLVSALWNGDRGAFAELYERYWQPLYRLSYQKIRSKELAEEIVQDLFVSLWAKRSASRILTLRPYLFAALRFSIFDHLESQRMQEQFLTGYESFMRQTNTQPVGDLNLQDLTSAIENSLQTLPEKSRRVFRLSRFEQLTIPEIAVQLNLSEKAIEYHLSRALKVVRLTLRDSAVLIALLSLGHS